MSDTKTLAMENLAGARRLRETEEARWARTIAAALATGNTVEEVAAISGEREVVIRGIAEMLDVQDR